MERRLQSFLSTETRQSAKVLEIGCGPVGNVSLINWGERYAVDPLNDFYAQQEEFVRHRNPAVHYATSMREKLAFRDSFFNLLIMENVLDHVQAASKMLGEAHRVLAGGGLFYFTVNVRRPWGTALHKVLSKLQIDKGHPYSFTHASIKDFLNRHDFEIQLEEVEDYKVARTKERSSRSWKDKIKGYSGLTEFVFYAVCSRR